MIVEERPLAKRADATMTHLPIWSDLPPSQAGVAAALRRAFKAPTGGNARFEELLQKLC